LWDVLQQRSATPQKWYLEVETSEAGVSMVSPVNNPSNALTDDNIETRVW